MLRHTHYAKMSGEPGRCSLQLRTALCASTRVYRSRAFALRAPTGTLSLPCFAGTRLSLLIPSQKRPYLGDIRWRVVTKSQSFSKVISLATDCSTWVCRGAPNCVGLRIRRSRDPTMQLVRSRFQPATSPQGDYTPPIIGFLTMVW